MSKSVLHGTENISFVGSKIWGIVPTEFQKLSSISLFKKAIKKMGTWKLSLLWKKNRFRDFVEYITTFASFWSTHWFYCFILLSYLYSYWIIYFHFFEFHITFYVHVWLTLIRIHAYIDINLRSTWHRLD